MESTSADWNSPTQADWTKGSWDFPQFPDGPWPEGDTRWGPFLEAIGDTWEHFKTLPAYYLAARSKGLIVSPTRYVYAQVPTTDGMYTGGLIKAGGKAEAQYKGQNLQIVLNEPVDHDIEFPKGQTFRVIGTEQDRVVVEPVQFAGDHPGQRHDPKTGRYVSKGGGGAAPADGLAEAKAMGVQTDYLIAQQDSYLIKDIHGDPNWGYPRWDAVAQENGMTRDQYTKALDAHYKQELAGAEVWTQMRPAAFQSFLAQGETKTIFDKGGKSAASANYKGKKKDYLEERERVEGLMFGSSHPFYGYAAKHPDGGLQDMSPYGSIAVRLKPSVKDQATVTMSDSLNVNMGVGTVRGPVIQAVPSSYHNPSWRSDTTPMKGRYDPLHRSIQKGSWHDDKGPYPMDTPEVQIHRRVRRDEIAEVVFYKAPTAQQTSALEKLGIPFRAVTDKGYNAWEEDPGARG